MAKPALRSADAAIADGTRGTLAYVLENALRLLHPFMPFITEEIWQQLPHAEGARDEHHDLRLAAAREELRDAEAESRMALLMAIIGAVRKLRAEQGVAPSQKVDIRLASDDAVVRELATAGEEILKVLARAEQPHHHPGNGGDHRRTALLERHPVAGEHHAELSAEERQKEKEKAQRELAKLIVEAEKLAARLNNPNFRRQSPAGSGGKRPGRPGGTAAPAREFWRKG